MQVEKLALWWSPMIPTTPASTPASPPPLPRDAGNTWYPHPFISPAGSSDPASEVCITGDDHTWQQSISWGSGLSEPSLRVALCSWCSRGSLDSKGGGWELRSLLQSENPGLQPLCEVPSTHSAGCCSSLSIVGEPGQQQGERSHFAFLEKGLRNEPPKESGKERSERQIPASS